MKNEPRDDLVFPEDVQDFAKRYCHQKKDLLFLNPHDSVCQVHSAAARNARTTKYDCHAPAVPTQNPVQSAR